MVASHPPFFVTLVAGLLIAFALQLLLTNFGIAAGITALGSLPFEDGNDREPSPATYPDRASRPIGLAVGLGTLLTVNLALFAAGFLAVKLSMTDDWMVGAVLGIVIWSAYFLMLVWLGTTTVGVLFGTAVKVINSGWRGLRAIATTALQPAPLTESQRYEDLYRQLSQELNQTLNRAISQTSSEELSNKKPNWQPNQESNTESDTPQPDNQADGKNANRTSQPDDGSNRGKWAISPAKQLQTGIEKTIAMTRQMLAPECDIKQSLKTYLLNASAQQLTRKTIPSDFKVILHRSDISKATVKQQLTQLQRNDFVAWLRQRDDLSPKKIAKIANRLEVVRLEVLDAINDGGDDQSSSLNWETVQSQLQAVLEQPQAIAPAVLPLLSKIDWHRVMDQIQTNDHLSPEQVNLVTSQVQQVIDQIAKLPQAVTNQASQLIDQLETIPTTLAEQTTQLQHLAQQQVTALQQQAKHQVETARKTAMIAAWWLFVTASTSLVTTAIAGALAGHLIGD